MMEGVIPPSEEVAFEPKPEEKEELGMGKSHPGEGGNPDRGNSKDPEAGAKILGQVQRS